MRWKTTITFGYLIACIALLSCKKENSTTSAPVRFYLTDAPASYDEVNVEIKEILIKSRKDSASWIPMHTKPGIYNLLSLQNGVSTLIADGELPVDTLKEVRFVLGTENSVTVNGQSYPLETPGAEDAGLKIKIGKKIKSYS